MEFRIADTFTGSLARLTGDEQKAVKTTAFDLQLDPANPGMSFHKLEGTKEYRWEKWTVFLHPAQRDIIERQYKGPARVAGSAGTGKGLRSNASRRPSCAYRAAPGLGPARPSPASGRRLTSLKQTWFTKDESMVA